MSFKKPVLHLLLATFVISMVPTTSAEAFFFDFFKRRKRNLPTIAEVVINSQPDEFSTLLTGVLAVTEDPNLPDLVDALFNAPLTVFAPTDAAFAELGLDSSNIATALPLPVLSDILLYHVTPGKKGAIRLLIEGEAEMLNGDSTDIDLSFWPFGVYVNDARVVDANIRARNGFVHVIDQVLMPPMDAPPSAVGISNIPEPSSIALSLSSCGLLLVRRRRQ